MPRAVMPFKTEHVEYVRKNALKFTYDDIADKLDLEVHTVKAIVKQLGIKKNHRWLTPELVILRKHDLEECYKLLPHIDRTAIINKRNALGIRLKTTRQL